MIGERIQRARQAAGLSLRELAEVAGVSAMAISKYEREQNTPSSNVLISLSNALGVRVEYFFRQGGVHLNGVEFRKHASLSKGEQSRIIADVQDRLERWHALDEIFPAASEIRFRVPKTVPKAIHSGDDIEQAALKVRDAWGLGHNPIQALIDTLEEQGIRVIVTPYISKERFDGLSARADERPIIAIGTEWPGDRQRFTLAHELGHLILEDRMSTEYSEELGLEKACDRFAGAFLAPKDVVLDLLGKKRTWLEPRELYLLKHEYGLSMAAWTYRARDLGILDKSTHGKYWGFLRKKSWHKTEPGDPYPSEKSHLFDIRVYHALAEDWLGESKAAELLGMPIIELRNWNKERSGRATDQ